MSRLRDSVVLLALVACVSFGIAIVPARAGSLYTGAAAASPSSILVSWTWVEYPEYPTGQPQWVGFDVWRRAAATCGAWERVNPAMIARTPGVTQSESFLDTTPVPATTYEYRVRLVDANRDFVYFAAPDCMWPCNPPAYAMCPDLASPVIEGTVSEWGWAVLVSGCTNGCWGTAYVENPLADELRPYVGTGQSLRVFGHAACGTMEGCAMQVDHFELGDCGSTPARRSSWGALKSHYR
jgi:hypothetical protein